MQSVQCFGSFFLFRDSSHLFCQILSMCWLIFCWRPWWIQRGQGRFYHGYRHFSVLVGFFMFYYTHMTWYPDKVYIFPGFYCCVSYLVDGVRWCFGSVFVNWFKGIETVCEDGDVTISRGVRDVDEGLLNSRCFDCGHREIILHRKALFSFVDGILNAIPVLLLLAFDPSVKICIEFLYSSIFASAAFFIVMLSVPSSLNEMASDVSTVGCSLCQNGYSEKLLWIIFSFSPIILEFLLFSWQMGSLPVGYVA